MLKGERYIPGFGTTLPTDKIDRQLALQERMKKQAEAEEALNQKIIKELYVEPKGTSKTK